MDFKVDILFPPSPTYHEEEEENRLEDFHDEDDGSSFEDEPDGGRLLQDDAEDDRLRQRPAAAAEPELLHPELRLSNSNVSSVSSGSGHRFRDSCDTVVRVPAGGGSLRGGGGSVTPRSDCTLQQRGGSVTSRSECTSRGRSKTDAGVVERGSNNNIPG